MVIQLTPTSKKARNCYGVSEGALLRPLFLCFFSFTNIFLLKYMGLYHGIWRYASIHEIKSIIKSVSISILLLLGIFFLVFRLEDIPRSFPILLFIISIFSVTSPRVFYRIMKDYLKIN